MFANTDNSNIRSSTTTYNNILDNICCSDDETLTTNKDVKALIDNRAEIVIITEHLCIPCPRLYSDIFGTILIVCIDKSHKNDRYSDDCKVDAKIKQLIERKKSNGLH